MPRDTAMEKAVREIVGDRIATSRAVREMSQDALGDRPRRTQGWVSEVERGKRGLTTAQVWEIARILGVSVDTLVGEPRTPKEQRAVNGAPTP